MLNAQGERELVYVVTIDGIEPIPNYDRVEQAIVGGWRVIVQKGQFKVGDPAIYFEIDSKVPSDRECFAFLEKRKYKIKTIRMCGTISQGLLMHAQDLGWKINNFNDAIIDDKAHRHYPNDDETRFLTKQLGVTYAEAEDNQRKAPSVDKYKKMAQRNPKIFKQTWARWLMKREWGRRAMFAVFGNKRDKKNGWPSWVVKTDEERIENMPWILKNKDIKWIATEKIDGSSTTFTMRRRKFGKVEFYVCSRNVCFDSVDKPCYYDTNIYWEMAQKYDMYNVLKGLLNESGCEWVTIQGETFGANVQKNNYDLSGHDFRAFNLIYSDCGRVNSVSMASTLTARGVPCVPVFSESITMPDTVEELREYVNGIPSVINGKMREGVVFRTWDGQQSFKCVSPEYLLKFHA